MGVLEGWKHCPHCSAALRHADGRVECKACGFVQWAHSSPAVAALLVDDEDRVLLARRARQPDEGKWDSPGGFLEEGEDPLSGLRRELYEETGLTVEPGDFVGAYMDIYGDESRAHSVLNLVWEATASDGEPKPDDDVSELRWFPKDALPPDDELAFRWLGPCLRSWAKTS